MNNLVNSLLSRPSPIVIPEKQPTPELQPVPLPFPITSLTMSTEPQTASRFSGRVVRLPGQRLTHPVVSLYLNNIQLADTHMQSKRPMDESQDWLGELVEEQDPTSAEALEKECEEQKLTEVVEVDPEKPEVDQEVDQEKLGELTQLKIKRVASVSSVVSSTGSFVMLDLEQEREGAKTPLPSSISIIQVISSDNELAISNESHSLKKEAGMLSKLTTWLLPSFLVGNAQPIKDEKQ